jgi:hypothetical protein
MTVQTEYLSPCVLPESILAELFDASERAATIVAAAIIDDELKRMLIEALEPIPNPEEDPLFDSGETPLRSFNAKIILARRMKLITLEFADFLHRLRDLRNKYAHFPAFEGTSIKDKRNSLTTDYFYGVADTIIGRKTSKPKYEPITVSGSYARKDTPLNRMLARGANPDEVSFRMLLVTMIGHLYKPSFDSAERQIDITITYVSGRDKSKDAPPLVIDLSLHFDG